MSGLIPQAFIDDLLSRTDLVVLVDSFIPLKKRGTSHIACCPFHNEKTPSFNVIAKKQFYHCFGCGASGNAISFAMNYLNQGFTEAVETLAARLGLSVPREGQSEKNVASFNLYRLLEQVNTYYEQQLKQNGQNAIEYMKARGLSGQIVKTYQLGYAPDGWHGLEAAFSKHQKELITTGMLIKNEQHKIYDRYRNRIMFPIHDRHGRIIGFGGRVLDTIQKPKYLNSPETPIFQKNRELYGLHQILKHHTSIEYIIVVEGYMDVIALAQHGIVNAVATLGTATSTFHIQLLAKHTKRLIFCFDGDTAGQQAAWRALESSLPHLNSGLDAGFIFLPNEHDPDSLVRTEGKEKFLAYINQATPLNQFIFDTLKYNINLSTPAGKTQLIQAAKPFIQKMPDGSYKQLLIDELSRLTHIENHRLSHLLVDDKNIQKIEKPTPLTRTPIRIAMALLLQNPELFEAHKENIQVTTHHEEPEYAMLCKIVAHLKTNPKSNTAMLLEQFRNTTDFESISQLSAWEHQVPEQELAKELIDTLVFLHKQSQDHLIRQLIDTSRKKGLTVEEKNKLMDLLKKRHAPVEITRS
jgi:DNA primase